MEPIYIYPGRFNPPTKGHFEIVKRCAEIFPSIKIICSTNPSKDDIFSVKECKEMWDGYDLPKNAEVFTFDEFVAKPYPRESIVIIRGIRDYTDIAHENDMLKLNHSNYGIDKYFYLLSDCKNRDISATRARSLAKNLALFELSECVCPLAVTKLLEKTLEQRSITLVVGKPGSGKSTFLGMLKNYARNVVVINTDEFNKMLRPLLIEHYGEKDLVRIALEREDELKSIIARPWTELLVSCLMAAPKHSHIFVEVAYGLQDDKALYKLLGARTLLFACESDETNKKRVVDRGTSHMLEFVESIPGLFESKLIAKKHKLLLRAIKTDGSLLDLEKKAINFAKTIDEVK